jgi:molybdopterin/thiamine biosynthesis adenylyltransferase
MDIIKDYDIIVDGCDNFPTRYLVNDACILANKSNVHGSIFQFDGQATVFYPGKGPCYRCLFLNRLRRPRRRVAQRLYAGSLVCLHQALEQLN